MKFRTVHDQDRNRAHRSRTLSHPRGLRANGRPYSKSHVRMPRGVEPRIFEKPRLKSFAVFVRQTKKAHRWVPNHKHDLIEKLQHWKSHTPTNDGRNTRTETAKEQKIQAIEVEYRQRRAELERTYRKKHESLKEEATQSLQDAQKQKAALLKPRKNRFGLPKRCLSPRKTSPMKNLP